MGCKKRNDPVGSTLRYEMKKCIVVPVTGTGSLKVGTAWFLLVPGQYKLVLLVTWW